MRNKTFYAQVEVDVDYDIKFDDLLELIESCNPDELDEIRDLVGMENDVFETSNLYDEMKMNIIKQAFEKYDLDELREKLNIR